MPAVSDTVRFVILVITGLATLLFGFMGFLLEPNIRWWVRGLLPGEKQGGPRPKARPVTTWVIFFTAIALMVLGGAVASAAPALEEAPPGRMTGDFRIAFAPFTRAGGDIPQELGEEIAASSYQRVLKITAAESSDLTVTVWGPDDLRKNRAGEIAGETAASRAQSAEALADRIGADVILYGSLEQSQGALVVAPEFYVRFRGSYELDEVTGAYQLGVPLRVASFEDVADRVAVNKALSGRSEALKDMLVGLSYYAIREYAQALDTLKAAEAIENWQEGEGKIVLYQLIANAAVRGGDLAQAEAYYAKALALEPDYSRALIGMANIHYRKALKPFEESKNPPDVNREQMELALSLLEQAQSSPNQPPLADIGAKVHFERGQCLLMMAYAGFIPAYDPALDEFTQVLAAYADGANPRLLERGAESHARLGLIYSLTGKNEEAVAAYRRAADLLADDPDRQAQYLQRADRIRKSISPQEPEQ